MALSCLQVDDYFVAISPYVCVPNDTYFAQDDFLVYNINGFAYTTHDFPPEWNALSLERQEMYARMQFDTYLPNDYANRLTMRTSNSTSPIYSFFTCFDGPTIDKTRATACIHYTTYSNSVCDDYELNTLVSFAHVENASLVSI